MKLPFTRKRQSTPIDLIPGPKEWIALGKRLAERPVIAKTEVQPVRKLKPIAR